MYEAARIFQRLSRRLAGKEKNGWEGRIREIEVLSVPGGHRTILEEGLGPIVRSISERLAGPPPE